MPVYRLSSSGIAFPPPGNAEPDGLLAVGGDLSPQRIIAAYTSGIFPWYSDDSPILWWSPDPRCVLLPAEFHMPRSLRRILKANLFTVTCDTAFEKVITACAGPRQCDPSGMPGGTWLVPDMIKAYCKLHEIGIAHSFEAWKDGELVGGLYGVSLGRVFFGESMFYRAPDASKAALAHLVELTSAQGFTLIDCQQETENLLRFGAKPMPRNEFLERLEAALDFPTLKGSWKNLA